MRILLIQPPRPELQGPADGTWRLIRPHSLFSLAAAVRASGRHEVEILDLELRQHRTSRLEESIASATVARVYGITATTYTRFEAIRASALLKRRDPRCVVIVGGLHFTSVAAETIRRVDSIDVVVHGEGEDTLLDVLDALEAGRSLGAIPGISWREAGVPRTNAGQRPPVRHDDFPPYFDYRVEDYPEYLFGVPGAVRATSLMASRGCPYHCIFCIKSDTGYRRRGIDRVLDELEVLLDRSSVQAANFLDLSFTANPSYARAICDGILARGIRVKWWCFTMAHTAPRLLDRMAEAGCVATEIAIESGSPRVLSRMVKGVDIEEAVSLCEHAASLGIAVRPLMTYSYPDETREDVLLTLDLMARLETVTRPCGFFPLAIFPGTELEEEARQRGILPPGFSWFEPYHSEINAVIGSYLNIPLFTDKLSHQDILDLQVRYNNRSWR